MLVRSPLPVDEFTLDTWFEPPCGSASLVESTLATVLPDHPGRYWREIRFDLDFYLDVSYAVAHDYCWSKARWWCQVTCDGRVVARSADQPELPGCLQWLERIAERERLAYQKANLPFNWCQWLRSMPDLLGSLASLKGSFSGPGGDPPPSPARMAVELHPLMNPEDEGESN